MNSACLDVRTHEVVILASLATVGLMLHTTKIRTCDVVNVGDRNDRSALRPLLLKLATREARLAILAECVMRKVQILAE